MLTYYRTVHAYHNELVINTIHTTTVHHMLTHDTTFSHL